MSIIEPVSFLKYCVQNVMTSSSPSVPPKPCFWRYIMAYKPFMNFSIYKKVLRSTVLPCKFLPDFVYMIMLFIYIFLQMYCYSYMHSLFQVCCWCRCQGRPNGILASPPPFSVTLWRRDLLLRVLSYLWVTSLSRGRPRAHSSGILRTKTGVCANLRTVL